MSDAAVERLAFIDDLYRNEEEERASMNEALEDLGVEVPTVKKAPFEKVYFTGEMLAKYEPCMESLQNVVDADGEDDDSWKKFEKFFANFMDFSWMSQWNGKKYDIVIYGASGYMGYVVMEYLKRVALKKTTEKFTFALAGRSAAKVAAQRDLQFKGTQWADTPILVADHDEPVTMIDLAKSASVILNIAGPYMLAPGEIMLDACCHTGAHYVDVNGELPWFFRTLDLDKRARASKTLIVPAAGPGGGIPDMLTYLCHKQIKDQNGDKEELRKAVSYQRTGGTVAAPCGGNVAARSAMLSEGPETIKLMADPFALSGFIPDRDNNGLKEVTIKQGTGETTMKVRKEDSDSVLAKMSEDTVNKVWRLPQAYAYFDTRVVRRTNALLADHLGAPYGCEFNFTEYTMLPNTDTPQKAAEDTTEYKQGEGPQLEELEDSWTGWFNYVESANGHTTKNCMQGNDGYFETARCSTETSLALAFDYDKLPIKGGCVTLGAAAAEAVSKRLIASGIKFQQGDWDIELAPIGSK